jgi:hypothetical protein
MPIRVGCLKIPTLYFIPNPMNKVPNIDACLAKLNELLTRHFHAEAPDFAGKAKTAASQLPNELAQALAELVEARAVLEKTGPESERFMDFAFQCGCVYERLDAHRRIEMEMENVVIGPESVAANPLQSSQVEPLARFIEVRDRLFRKVADFTLKALLVVLGLLTLGLMLGLV